MYFLRGMNMELTTSCPLRCPQCYCSLDGAKFLDLNIAKNNLAEAASHGVKTVNLSGGETLCYPFLFDVIKFAADKGIAVNVALSGYRFEEPVLKHLVSAGVSGIYISLNGSTEEINSLTRDGYGYAIHALSVLKEFKYEKSYINWVMHSNNAADFNNVVKLAEEYNIRHIVVLAFKPDSSHQLISFPNANQIRELADYIKSYRGTVQIMVETCFSQLLAVIRDTELWGNLNCGLYKGCGAGRWSFSINVDGLFSPCRHLDIFEKWDSIADYWNNSPVLDKLRNIENDKRDPCNQCRYSDNCRHCAAVNHKLHGQLYIGHDMCQLSNTIK